MPEIALKPQLTCRFRWLYLLLFMVVLLPQRGWSAREPQVPQRYAHWLNQEVNYLITTDERRLFLHLSSDQARDQFIDSFWKARNPSRDAANNVFEEEHYRRLAYANQHFGSLSHGDGASTDRGMVYITLGPPAQTQPYPETKYLNPLEIWFYQNTSGAIPLHFYVLFYKRSAAEEYRLYSPTGDRPQKLINSTNAINDDARAIKIIQEDLNDEVAHIALSLIPGEPVDLKSPEPSMQSDVLLSKIRNYWNLPENRELLSLRRAQERVTSSVFLDQNQAELQTVVFRGTDTRMTLNYLLRYRHPDATFIGRLADGKTGYSMTMRTTVMTPSGVTAYEEEDRLTGVVTEAQAENARKRSFGAEGRLPLAPGEYKVAVTLTNDLTHVAVRQVGKVTVPDPRQAAWSSSNVMTFTAQPAVSTGAATVPFSVAGLRFVPRGVQSVEVHSGEKVRLLFQLWRRPDLGASPGESKAKVSTEFPGQSSTPSPSGSMTPSLTQWTPQSSTESKIPPDSKMEPRIRISYVLGTVQGGGVAKEESEEVDGHNFDSSSGAFLTGHTLATEGQAPGTYRVVITATEPKTGQKAFATMTLRIVDESEPTELWTAYDSLPPGARTDATDDYKRGLCAVALGQRDGAKQWLQRSIKEDGEYMEPVAKLADLYARDGEYKQLAELSRNSAIARELDEGTLLLMANANSKVGDLKRATEILEGELQTHPPSASVYLALAQLYDQAGNASKAKQYRQRASSL